MEKIPLIILSLAFITMVLVLIQTIVYDGILFWLGTLPLIGAFVIILVILLNTEVTIEDGYNIRFR